MSHSEEIYISYYSAVLAKALKLYDDITFNHLFEIISTLSDKEKAYKAKKRAIEISKLPLSTLNSKIRWSEKLCVDSVKLPNMESLIESKNKIISSAQAGTNHDEILSSEIDNLNTVAEARNFPVHDYSDLFKKDLPECKCDDNDECKPLLYNDGASDDEPVNQSNVAKQLTFDDSEKLRINKEQCTIEMHDCMHGGEDRPIYNNPSAKTYYTGDDFLREQLTKASCSRPNDPAELSGAQTKVTDGIASLQDESKKKLKKKKKSKIKGNTLSEAISSKASTSLEFSKYSETQPLLQHDPNSDESFKKKFQEYADDGKRCETRILTATKAERKTLIGNSLSKLLSHEKVEEIPSVREDKSALKKKKVQENKSIAAKKSLTDERVEEILILCGDKSALKKKKAKDNKSNAAKKEKKKLRKQKKADKKKASINIDVSDGDEATPQKPEVIEVKTTTPEPNVNVVDDNSNEFIMQRRKKISHKHSVSGRVSPFTKEPARKRRFSDPSPSVASNEQSFCGQADPSSVQTLRKSWENPESETTSNEVYDRSNQVQWPTLPSQGDPNSSKSSDGSGSASYASKLKMNMDSTGCSLASSSEETSSSSSSSNNYQTRSSPLHDPLNALSDISKYIHEAAGFVGKSKCIAVPQDENSHFRVKDDEALHIVDNDVEAKLFDSLEVIPKTDEATHSSELKLSTNATATPLDTVHTEESIALQFMSTPEEKTAESQTDDNAEKKIDSNLSDCGDLLQDELLSKLKNKWGLDFFVSDLSSQAAIAQTPAVASAPDNNISELVCFGDGKLPVDAKTSHSEIQVVTGIQQHSSLDICFDTDREVDYDSGDFDVEKASALLFQEWNKALEKGIFYKDM